MSRLMYIAMKRMKTLLAIDHAMAGCCSVALQLDDGSVTSRCVNAHRGSDRLLYMIDQLMRDRQVSIQTLDGLVWTHGPGRFIGLRVVAGVVQALSYATEKPVCGLSTLRVMAHLALCKQTAFCYALVAIHAGSQRVYWGIYHMQDGLTCALQPDDVCLPEAVSCVPEYLDQPCLAVGEAWHGFSGALKQACAPLNIVDQASLPNSYGAMMAEGCLSIVAHLDQQKVDRSDLWTMQTETVLPHYLYENVARS